ncbi:retinol dehydrogenase [Legionella lansingensis]|uniref:Short chain dehydrogenase/reductase family oxidoreductase n=1 Tax=Legionella lansingensis TaxID=45067 RepID=A0A0W0VRT2_9GAMM|nr:SDR family oxidoreductase [Legionella lansingensis]KTD22859.1 short chain dehydrogenase/reductase family oxidoreductase [Legionella lansingensis]SNV53660.1 retinol dehydrogenase [Legionella lansingensis]
MKKIILVTGTSSGLGLSVSIKLAEQGHIVYASMRNLHKADQIKQAIANKNLNNVHLIQMDVESTESVTHAVSTVLNENGRIDCLINNAGMGFVETTEKASEEKINQVMNINFMGVVRTIKAVLPAMRQAKSGQIINITSVGGLIGQPFNEIYCASKFAVEGLTESMASYIQPFFNIKFTAIEPGGIVSEFSTNVMKNSIIDLAANDEYAPIFKRYFEDARERLKNPSELGVYQSSDQVADCIVDVVNSKNPPLRIRTSEWAENFCKLKTQSDPMGTKSVATVYKLFLAHEAETDVSVV